MKPLSHLQAKEMLAAILLLETNLCDRYKSKHKHCKSGNNFKQEEDTDQA
jgi:hypothetical protein